jgi:hypothetical protein
MAWDDLDMEREQWREDFEQRVEEGSRELCSRFDALERGCRAAEEARRRDWEAAEGRVMTAAEKLQHQHDGFMRLLSTMGAEYMGALNALGVDMEQRFAEGKEENRAQTEALMRMLDRLPPTENRR